MHARGRFFVVCAITFFFLVQASARLYTRVPWCDEGFFADPATSLLEQHSLGSRAADSNRVWITGDLVQQIHRYFYYLPPLYPVTLAGWWAAVGHGIYAMRWMSVIFGLVLLVSTYSLAQALTKSTTVALLAAALLSVDYHFVTAAADGRMDCMMTALGFASLSTYVELQGRGKLKLGTIAASTLLGLAILTHPNAVFYVPLLLLLLYKDGELFETRARPLQVLALLGTPQIFLFGAWGIYISQNPNAFLTQFRMNLAYHPASHFVGGLIGELNRYDVTLASAPLSDHLRMFTTVPLVALAVVAWIKLRKTVLWPLLLLSVMAALMTFLMGRKWTGYLIDILPLYSIVAAACVVYHRPKVTGLIVAAYALVCLAFTANAVRLDRYHREFQPTAAFLKQHMTASTYVTGAAYLGLGIGFEKLNDDFTLGRREGPLPDYIVEDEWYTTLTDSLDGTHTGLSEHVYETLRHATKVFEDGQYRVYGCGADCKTLIASAQRSK